MKAYIAPSTTVVRVHLESQLMQASKVGSVSTNLDEGAAIGYGGGGSGPARVKSNTVDWDDDWSE
ncbi:MAG: hypothetical protein IJ066_02745 [Bacteroidaceae bacterium]|nr:hypothetical protein [Bacteroidaceae bacterium]